jgi:hypothetical protein
VFNKEEEKKDKDLELKIKKDSSGMITGGTMSTIMQLKSSSSLKKTRQLRNKNKVQLVVVVAIVVVVKVAVVMKAHHNLMTVLQKSKRLRKLRKRK